MILEDGKLKVGGRTCPRLSYGKVYIRNMLPKIILHGMSVRDYRCAFSYVKVPDMFIANIRNGQDGIDFYETFVVGKNKPMLIAETAAFDPNKDPTLPGERTSLNETEQVEFKNEWIKQVYNVSTLKENFPRLNAVCYFHVNKTEPSM